MTITEADYKKPFAVEFGNDLNAEVSGNCKYFESYAEALTFAESQAERLVFGYRKLAATHLSFRNPIVSIGCISGGQSE